MSPKSAGKREFSSPFRNLALRLHNLPLRLYSSPLSGHCLEPLNLQAYSNDRLTTPTYPRRRVKAVDDLDELQAGGQL
jgi:hypothetical protein